LSQPHHSLVPAPPPPCPSPTPALSQPHPCLVPAPPPLVWAGGRSGQAALGLLMTLTMQNQLPRK
ncbi:hypothetical protein P7K49_009048, partial [Saguinus oedipus]